MYFCFSITKSYVASLVLLTVISRAILLPLSLYAYRNSIRLAKIKPRLDDMKRYYSGDKERIAEEQLKLYKAGKYNPFMDLVPLFAQLLLIIGLIHVVYSPMQYLLQIPADVIASLTERAAHIAGVDNLGAAAQIKAIELLQNPAHASAFEGIAPEWVATIQQFDMNLLGMNLGMVPSFREWSIYLLIPVFAGLTAWLLSAVQNRSHVAQREQSKGAQWGTLVFFTAFASYFAFVVPAGLGFYWGVGNLLSILVLLLSNVICKPEKHIDYASRPKPQPVDKVALKANRFREKEDYRRFSSTEKKKLVFYSVKSGGYKYFKGVLEYVLENSDIHIHYVTSDPDDAIFSKNDPQLTPYYVADKKLISLMLYLDADVMVMTTPDLQKYHLKRSVARKDIEYVYIFHAVVSTHMIYRAGAFDHYDTIFCVGQYHMDEIRATEKKYGLKEKRLVPSGYSLIDELTADYEAMEKGQDGVKKILVAPSWQFDNIMESSLDGLLDQLLGKGYQIVVRPHPEFIKRFPGKMDAILTKYADKLGDDFVIETDFSSNVTIFTADLLITDWSGIAFEYAYATKRPCLFINTPMKVMNRSYKKIRRVPFEVSMRDRIGVSVDLDNMDSIAVTVEDLLASAADYSQQITEVLQENMFCVGHSGETGGRYILEQLKAK
ncbi:MAG: membrane protein insertase YidC [Clostridia bacterium]|nr:membrane protein insertase YidC [Clostridia bacterium]